jgi:hypothetical protein
MKCYFQENTLHPTSANRFSVHSSLNFYLLIFFRFYSIPSCNDRWTSWCHGRACPSWCRCWCTGKTVTSFYEEKAVMAVFSTRLFGQMAHPSNFTTEQLPDLIPRNLWWFHLAPPPSLRCCCIVSNNLYFYGFIPPYQKWFWGEHWKGVWVVCLYFSVWDWILRPLWQKDFGC